MAQQRRPELLLLWRRSSIAGIELIRVVNEVAAGTVRTEAYGVERAAGLCLIFGMTVEASQLVHAVSKLALGTVLAGPTFLICAAQFRLVSSGDVWWWWWRRRGSGGRGGSS